MTKSALSEEPQGASLVEPVDRRQWLRGIATAGLAGLLPAGCARRSEGPPAPASQLVRFPQKAPLRVINDRAPCLETPWHYYRTDLTPTEAFYVRWHLEAIPTTVDLRAWRLRVGGHVERPLELSLDELRRLPATSLVAVNQCSGNSRSRFEPRVPGSQWINGAMGNARWTGVRLRDLLRRAGVRAGAVQVTFNGLDEGPLPSVPDFVKALDVDHAQAPEVLVAYEMNGNPLPLLNGYPARLVVPGWYATYWVKSLVEITVLPHRFDGYWMAQAYRIPNTPGANETPRAHAAHTVPINRMNVRSFLVRPEPGERVPVGHSYTLDGIAFDGGRGIRQVQFSTDGGASWSEARLGPDLGPFSFRRWHADWAPQRLGEYRLQVRAVNGAGEGQPAVANWNKSGFMRNVIEEITVTVI